MDYHDKQKARVAIARHLMTDGWKLHGFHEDDSDMMTDYYSPAYWHGVAVKDNMVIVCGETRAQEAREIHKDIIVRIECPACFGTGTEPNTEAWNFEKARANPHAYYDWDEARRDDGCISIMRSVVSPLGFNDDGTIKCNKCGGTKKIIDHTQTTKEKIGDYPAHGGNRKRVQFQLEVDGVIVKEWFALKSYHVGYNDHDGSGKLSVNNALIELMGEITKLSQPKIIAVNTAKNRVSAENTRVVCENGITTGVNIVEYNGKCIAVFGDTKQFVNDFSRKRGGIGGVFNSRLTHDGEKKAGWIFKKDLLERVEEITGTKLIPNDV